MPSDNPSPQNPETEEDKLTRNLNELLQELRVTQTGVQILTGFLLTLPFTSRFQDLSDPQRYMYLAILCGSVVATGLIIGPVAFHRALFRRGERRWIVKASRTLGHVAGGISLVFFTALWAGVPLLKRLS